MSAPTKWTTAQSQGRLKVLVVYKKSRLELYSNEGDHFGFDQLLDRGELSLSHLQEGHDLHQECLAKVHEVLKGYDADVQSCYREQLPDVAVRDRVVVSVGGDGTMLDASHYIGSEPLFGVNSDPSRSVGSLCIATVETFADTFAQAMQGQLGLQPVVRIAAKLNGQPMPLTALNEFLIAHENPAAMSRYGIALGGQHEEHKSSGVWVGAPAGSTGAMFSAGGVVQELNEERFQWVVREPYHYDNHPPRLACGFVEAKAQLSITSRMPNGHIYVDGPHHRVSFGMGSHLELSAGADPLHLFVTPQMLERRRLVGRLNNTRGHV
jgi:NAD+ kinase